MATVTIRTLGRNSAYAALTELWRIGSRIVLTPLILTRIGLDGYGVWTLLFSVCAYVSVVNTSFGLAYTKFTAEYDAKRDYRGLSQIVGTGMLLVGSLALLGLSGLWLARFPILDFLGVPAEMAPKATKALFVVGACVLMRMSLGSVFEILTGLQRMDLQYKLNILASVVEFTVSLILLETGRGLLGLALGHASGQVASTATAWWLCKRVAPEIRVSPFQATRPALRLLLGLGGRFQLLYVIGLLNSQGFKLVLSALLGPATLAIYEIANKVLTLGDAVGGAVLAPLMPAFANVHAGESRAKQRALFEHGSRILSVLSVISFGFLAVFADRVITLWTAQEYPLAAWTVRCFAAAYVLKQLTGMATASLRGQGSVRLEIGWGIVNSLVWFALVYPGYLLGGFQGMVLVAILSLVVGSIWFLDRFARQQSISFLAYLRQMILRPLLVLSPVIALAGLYMHRWHVQPAFLHGRFAVLFDLVVWGALFGLVAATCAWFGVLSRFERETLTSALGRRKLAPVADGLSVPAPDGVREF